MVNTLALSSGLNCGSSLGGKIRRPMRFALLVESSLVTTMLQAVTRRSDELFTRDGAIIG